MQSLTIADFAWDDYFWKATVRLPAWDGFRRRRDTNRSPDPRPGSVALVFAPEGRDGSPLLESELQLVHWAVEHAPEMQHALLERLLDEYPALQESCREFADPEDAPSVQSARDFESVIELRAVNVHPIDHGGVPYVGFEFACSWDAEHGLGILMHGTRVVQIGGADTAILLWIAEKDARGGSRG